MKLRGRKQDAFPAFPESGSFLALDLGGTNFRVMVLELKDGKVVDDAIAFYHVEEHLRIGCGFRLFDYLAECIADFVHKQNLGTGRLPLGQHQVPHPYRVLITCNRC